MTKEAGVRCAGRIPREETAMQVRRIGAGLPATEAACATAPTDRLGDAVGCGLSMRCQVTWRRADEPSVLTDPSCRPAAPSEWRRLGATIDRNDTIPGPFGRPLQRISNAQNAFARIEGPPLSRLEPGARAIFTAVVAAPTTLSSALVLASAHGQAELHVDWTEVPPTFVLLHRRAALAVTAGTVEGLGLDVWRLALQASNETPEVIAVKPSLHVTSGIANAGMAVGLYAGLLRAACTEATPKSDESGTGGREP